MSRRGVNTSEERQRFTVSSDGNILLAQQSSPTRSSVVKRNRSRSASPCDVISELNQKKKPPFSCGYDSSGYSTASLSDEDVKITPPRHQQRGRVVTFSTDCLPDKSDLTHEQLLSMIKDLRTKLKESKKDVSLEKKKIKQKDKRMLKVINELSKRTNDVNVARRTIGLLIAVLLLGILALGYYNTMISKNVDTCLPSIPFINSMVKKAEQTNKKKKEQSLIADIYQW